MDCIFCKIINNEIPSYTIYEDEYVKCFLDNSPKKNAHTLIVPKKHFTDINDIPEDILLHVVSTAKKIMKLIEERMSADGFELVQNNGTLELVKHFHLHIIPNYKGRTKKLDPKEVYEILTK